MDFEEWMRQNHYRESTVKQTLSDLQRVGRSADENVIHALRRYSTFAAQYDIENDLTTIAGQLGIGTVRRLPQQAANQQRKLEARSYEDEDWDRLIAAVQGSSDPRDQVIWALVTTGMRIGDVLGVERKVLQALMVDPAAPYLAAEVKGGKIRHVPLGVPEPWFALAQGVLASKARNVAEYVCPGVVIQNMRGSCAYHRVNRRMKALRRALALSGRANTHRIRRTIAVKTLESTNNLQTTQHMLGHATDQSTKQYVDEVNFRKLKRVQRKIAGLE